ncbi:MAG TPA: MarR family transcriptional regulator [Steroidobacteraceae bacterium]|nr:MarR family transcriptional regulator [Steroidobacteraceae bacterium]
MPSKPSVPPLSAHLGYWLRFASNHVSYAFARKLADKDVTVAEWVVLHELYGEEAVGPSRLAERLGLTRGAISKLADRLIQKRLIVREDSAQDLRAHTLKMTRAGAALVPVLAGMADANDAEFFGGMSLKERATLERVLKGLVARHGFKSIPIS